MAGRGYKTEAVVLRSLRFGEADRVLHVYTLERGRVGAVAKGIRRTKSRFGARLEPHRREVRQLAERVLGEQDRAHAQEPEQRVLQHLAGRVEREDAGEPHGRVSYRPTPKGRPPPRGPRSSAA